jgi:hypothetical protein
LHKDISENGADRDSNVVFLVPVMGLTWLAFW